MLNATNERPDSIKTNSAAELQELVHRAQKGDSSALPELRRVLNDNPAIWQEYGDLALQSQAAWLHLLAGQDLLLGETVKRKMEELRAELAGSMPSSLELLLVERVVACWLQTHYADCTYAQAKQPDASPATLRELQHRQESAQRRYLSSIKQLALVRKLLKPALSPFELAARTVNESTVPRPLGAERPACRLASVN